MAVVLLPKPFWSKQVCEDLMADIKHYHYHHHISCVPDSTLFSLDFSHSEALEKIKYDTEAALK